MHLRKKDVNMINHKTSKNGIIPIYQIIIWKSSNIISLCLSISPIYQVIREKSSNFMSMLLVLVQIIQ